MSIKYIIIKRAEERFIQHKLIKEESLKLVIRKSKLKNRQLRITIAKYFLKNILERYNKTSDFFLFWGILKNSYGILQKLKEFSLKKFFLSFMIVFITSRFQSIKLYLLYIFPYLYIQWLSKLLCKWIVYLTKAIQYFSIYFQRNIQIGDIFYFLRSIENGHNKKIILKCCI